MKTNVLKLITFLFIGSGMLAKASAQEATYLVDDFEGANKGWNTVACYQDIRDNDHKEGLNTSNKVLFTNRGVNNDNWSGAILNLSTPVKGYNYVHIKMYRNNTNKPNLKVSENPAADLEPINTISMVANQWQDVVFDVSAYKETGINFIMIMVDRTSPLDAEAYLLADDIIMSNDPTPRTNGTGGGEVESEYCDNEVRHLNDPNGAADSKVYLTISNVDANTLMVKVKAPEGGKLLDVLQVNAPFAVITGADVDEGGSQSLEATVQYPTAPTGDVTLQILWSNPGWPGRWMIDNLTVPFNGKCNVVISDTESPVMTSAEVSGELTYNSVKLKLAATDNATSPIVKFIANDELNGITNKALTADAAGYVTIDGLKPGTIYNLIITAKDAANNLSKNSQTVTFTTIERTSECSGDKGHFAPANAEKKIHYTIAYKNGNITYTIAPLDNAKDITFALLQVNSVGYNMTVANDGKSATYTTTGNSGDIQNILFVYAVTGMAGNEMTAENCSSPSAIYYVVGACENSSTGIYTTEDDLKVTPNPVRNLLTIDSAKEISSIVVYNQMGQIIKTIPVNGNHKAFDMSNLSAGNYLVNIHHANGKNKVVKIIKQ
ncbi:T9SS type A sorting domain-containing protein [uncultured Bacteroides sp.]|uniref:T9SS type A sorting domain-containing protein n=1 Tax=uncultured Bacteroides sp. TaxID=162156 RepID=UPI002AAAED1D|nr:T9SS type A sorting domain-containing protein [uncultured Bacteroides sp.]